MYTQCPECDAAFRVTAEVLRQAAGKVRCGSCSAAFNALNYLSEHKPSVVEKPRTADAVPELTPDPAELEAAEPPKTISAEQSAALLKTLDELAGSDIRIEDTGVEWRVLDDVEETGEHESPAASHEDADLDDTGSLKWFIDDAPAPLDEGPSAEPGELDSPEVVEGTGEHAADEVMRFDDDTPLPEDFDFESVPAGEPEPDPVIETREDPSALEADQVDLALGEPEDWQELLGEVAEPDVETVAEGDEVVAEAASGSETEALADTEDEEREEAEILPDVDEQFATQAEAMGIDLSGIHAQAEAPEAGIEQGPDIDDTSIDDDLIAAAFEVEAKARTASDDETDGEFEIELDVENEDLVEPRDRELVVSTEADARLAAELGLDGTAQEDDAEQGEPVIPPPTEEEMTVDMMIDQDLLAIAVEDEDGFASTIVQKQSGSDGEPESADDGEDKVQAPEFDFDENSPLVETIIMEGEFVRDAVEEQKLEEARKQSGDPNEEAAAAEATTDAAESDEAKPKQAINYRMAAGIAALIVLLGAQILHQSREALATSAVFNNTIGPIYRILGNPVTPSWDVSGWRFEATKGSTDEGDEILTIYSRVGNTSDEPLPYPLISVSLTDRFEDIIGSKVLEPGEYLTGNLDTREAVEPGDNFSAVISIEAPDAEATGFKLNVCYRQPGGRLKCAIDDFK